ncbi:hypothetical protein CONPUDRAFT_151201 [Coniophora puteana RWD-64-598 SS2]|uniref:Uncharacterized protein n=1 Tax=Coniophora puteana (strain RWD-64-598) TaxID=741705 RepID=A0A5M3MYD4_CONPW|nr:uncharacterized protein CONPUDRAFT_151201 [Coniophora puteana RWD-64-598 SS2]EIW84158.1 hypothetical protein CONPUDRAFT_151201 [Coniophora puteana RWD-64-598 SS2]
MPSKRKQDTLVEYRCQSHRCHGGCNRYSLQTEQVTHLHKLQDEAMGLSSAETTADPQVLTAKPQGQPPVQGIEATGGNWELQDEEDYAQNEKTWTLEDPEDGTHSCDPDNVGGYSSNENVGILMQTSEIPAVTEEGLDNNSNDGHKLPADNVPDNLPAHEQLYQALKDFDFSNIKDLKLPNHNQRPEVFNNHTYIWNLYLKAFISVALHGNTLQSVHFQLNCKKCLFEVMCCDIPSLELPGLDGSACTMPTVLKSLGRLNLNFIVYLFVCLVCWATHYSNKLSALDLPKCLSKDCPGLLHSVKKLANGSVKCTPSLVVPYVPLECVLQYVLLHPGKWDQLQQWRRPGNKPGCNPPLKATGYNTFDDSITPMMERI